MHSMTGYGRAVVEQDGRQLTIELKSVNHRFLDLSFRMPRSFNFLEDEARKQIGNVLSRGHVDVYAQYKNTREDAKVIAVDLPLAHASQKALDELQQDTQLHDDRALMRIANMDDVLRVDEAEEDRDALRALMTEARGKALDEMQTMREKEGEALKNDILSRGDTLEQFTLAIEKRQPETVKEYEARLRARIEELLGDSKVDETRLLQEVAIMADRAAIDEETVRLHSHIAQLRQFCAAEEPIGRKLDFLVQEFNREVNTISSKSQDVPITRITVDAKAEIEKIREQVQNIE